MGLLIPPAGARNFSTGGLCVNTNARYNCGVFFAPLFTLTLFLQGPVLPPLHCLSPGGTGEIHASAKQPFGPIFVAAERGLFVADLEAKTLDLLDLRDGAPQGEILSLRFENSSCLEVVAKDGVYHIHPAWLFGRKLHSKKGERAERLGPPSPPILTHGGLSLAPNAEVATDAEGNMRLDLVARAKGGATFRWRLEGHHLWRPVKKSGGHALLGPIPPGKHRVFVVAMDEDLRFSEATPLILQRPLPKGLSKAVLIPAAGGSVLMIFLILVFPALGKGRTRVGRALLSAVAVSVLGLQVLAAIVPHAKGWPFVGFTMYTQTNEAQSLLYRPVIQARFEDGSKLEVVPSDGGITVPYTTFRGIVPLLNGGRQRRAEFRETLERNLGKAVKRLRVLGERTRLTAEGPKRAGTLLLALYPPLDRPSPPSQGGGR